MIEKIIDGEITCSCCGTHRKPVFVVSDPERLGLEYKDEKFINCRGCGKKLYPEHFDEGDEIKSSNSKNWEDGGMAKCPRCEHNHQTKSPYFVWQMMYDPPRDPPSKEKKKKQRNYGSGFKKEVRKLWGDSCVVPNCNKEVTEYHHVIPIFEGGLTTTTNVVPMCDKHHGKFGARGQHPLWYTEERYNEVNVEVITKKTLSWSGV